METINILCATDNNYAPYCGIMLTSLFESNKDCHFVVYVFEDGSLTNENVKKYHILAQKYGNEIVLKTIDEIMVRTFPINICLHITLPTYYRLLAAELLPKEMRKVIYLDCDIIVDGAINPFWNVNLDGYALGAIGTAEISCDAICNRLCFPSSYGFFNAGVLIFNLDYWREHGLSEKVVRYVNTNRANLPGMDQDTLNGVLYKEKVLLPARFNLMTKVYRSEFWNEYSIERQQYYIEESRKAVVIHYLTNEKPWDYRSYGGPFFSEWEKYRRKSLWRDCRNIKPLKKHVKHLVKRYLFPDMFRRQHNGWVVSPDTQQFYK